MNSDSNNDSTGFDHKAFLRSASRKPGVYQMYDSEAKLLYVGKAKNLKNRLASYFRQQGLSIKTQALVKRIARIDVTVTHTEIEALLLEQNLIKQHRPPFNILFRDDKSYPYIYLSGHKYPRLSFHRGAKKAKGRYFGPYPSSGAVKESLNLLQKIFKVRQCEDSFFNNRSRPCLQYQINRCSAPCVGFVDDHEYEEAVRHTTMFLEGHNKDLIKDLANDMERAAAELAFEVAAECRDKIQSLQQVQAKQYIEGEQGDVDIVAAAMSSGACCIHILYIRSGRVLGSKSFYPRLQLEENEGAVLAAFISQYYLASGARHEVPAHIVVSHPLEDAVTLKQAMQEVVGRQVQLSHQVRSQRARWQALASQAAQQNLTSFLSSKQTLRQRFESLQDVLSLPELPERLECFDISHSSGEATVASCVVFDTGGPVKSDYRRFNIEGITGGDDFAAMHQALERRYTRIKSGEGRLPDILVIDGGKGQVRQATEVLQELQVEDLLVIGIAKGTTRKAGFETLHRADSGEEFVMPADSAALHLLQHIRDEAHRFAVTGHKQRRDKKRRESPLEGINGVGPKRRRDLLRHFGGWQAVAKAGVEDLCKVPGISEKLARDIYAALHNG